MKRFDESHMAEIIEYNRLECSRRNELFNVESQLLSKIIDKMNQSSDILDNKERVLEQASIFMGLIVFEQPFSNANKSTATAVTIDFLHSNGFDVDLRDTKIQSELLDIQEKTMYLFEDESRKGIDMLKEFLIRRMRALH